MIVDHDLAELTAPDLTRAITASRALAYFGQTHDSAAIGRVAASLLASLEAEQAARATGLDRGSVRLSVDAFADDPPDEAERARLQAVGYLGLVRDDHDERAAVRHLFGAVMAELEPFDRFHRAAELARFDAL